MIRARGLLSQIMENEMDKKTANDMATRVWEFKGFSVE